MIFCEKEVEKPDSKGQRENKKWEKKIRDRFGKRPTGNSITIEEQVKKKKKAESGFGA